MRTHRLPSSSPIISPYHPKHLKVDSVTRDNVGSAHNVRTELSNLLRKNHQAVVRFGERKDKIIESRRKILPAGSERLSKSEEVTQGMPLSSARVFVTLCCRRRKNHRSCGSIR